jgi:hypothetical protein
MGNGETWDAVEPTEITRVGTITEGTWQANPIGGEYIELLAGGGLMHGSGLGIHLAGDGTLIVDGTGLRVGQIDGSHISDSSVALGTDTVGPYVAEITAGDGLSGDAAGEGSNPTIRVNVDGVTLTIADDVLQVAEGGVGAAELAPQAVTDQKIADNAVKTAKIADGNVTNPKLADGAVTGSKMAPGTVTGTQLADGAVTGSKMAPGTVTGTQLADGAVTGSKMAPGTVTGTQLADGAVTNSKLGEEAVAAGNLAYGIDASPIAFNAAAVAGRTVDDSGLDTSSLWTAAKTKDYVDSLVNGLDWQNSVQSFTTVVPAAPAAGGRYIANGAPGWNTDSIYEYNGETWREIVPEEGFACWVDDSDVNVVFNGIEWVVFGSTDNHESLTGLQGGQTGQHFHLNDAQHTALTTLTPNRLAGTDEAGNLRSENLGSWIQGQTGQIDVQQNGDGTVTLDLENNVPAATPAAGAILMGDGTAWATADTTAITALGTVTTGTWQADPIAGDFVKIVDGGGLAVGGGGRGLGVDNGLQIDLASDGSLVVDGNGLRVGQIDGSNIVDQTVVLGVDTDGDYVAQIDTGPGLTGAAGGAGSHPVIGLNVDGVTLKLAGDSLQVAPAGIGAPELADGAVIHSKLADDAVALNNLASGIDASGIGFNAATVEGRRVDDLGDTTDVLWTAARIGEVIRDKIDGIDWQNSVIGVIETIPPVIQAGDRYISLSVPGWTANSIYEYDGKQWHETAPNEGFACWIEDADIPLVFNGTEWVPLGAAGDHETLSNLQGGTAGEHYHLNADEHATVQALDGLAPNRPLATDTGGAPVASAAAAWIAGTANEIDVQDDGDGTVTLSLPDTVPAAPATPGHILMAGSSETPGWQSVDLSEITRVGTISNGVWQGTPIDGAYVALAPAGGITHGSGLQLALTGDGTLVVDASGLRVGQISGANIIDQSIHEADLQDGSITDSKLKQLVATDKVAASAVQVDPAGGLLKAGAGLRVDDTAFLRTTGGTLTGPLTVEGATTLGDTADDQVLVTGALQIASGNPGTGKVLTSDGAGNATWENPDAGATVPNVVRVGAGGSIQSAIDAITDASPTNPYLIKVGPGVYTERVTLKDYIDLVGAGVGKTIISTTGSSNTGMPGPTDTALSAFGTDIGIRHLTVEVIRASAGGMAAGVYISGTGVRLLHVEIETQCNGFLSCGIVDGSSASVENCEIRAQGEAQYVFGVRGDYGLSSYRDSHISAFSYSSAADAATAGIYAPYGMNAAAVVGLRIEVSGNPYVEPPAFTAGIRAEMSGGVLRDLDIQASGAALSAMYAYGLEVHHCVLRGDTGADVNASDVSLHHSTINCQSPSGYGLYMASSSTCALYHTDIFANDTAVLVADAGSKLKGFYATIRGIIDGGQIADSFLWIRSVRLDATTGNPAEELHDLGL